MSETANIIERFCSLVFLIDAIVQFSGYVMICSNSFHIFFLSHSSHHCISIIQERTGLIPGLEKAESLKIQRNGSIDADVTGTDAWFYLIEPGTFRIVPSDDSRVKTTLFDTKAQNSLLNIVIQTLGKTLNHTRYRSFFQLYRANC